MDRDLFDQLSRLVAAGTRRDAVRLLLSGVVAGIAAGEEAVARGKHQNKNKHQRKRKHRNRKRRRSRAGTPGTSPTPGTGGTPRNGSACLSGCTTTCANQPIQAGANLAGCDLTGRDLAGTNLGGTNLAGACLDNATLRDVSFRGANLDQACLCGADLAGSDFRGATVTTQQLACATVTCATTLPDGASAVPCAAGLTCCSNLCVPTAIDPTNCGGCGNGCAPLQICDNGICRVLPGTCLPAGSDLQSAINATGPGGTLILCEGRFPAVNLTVTKSLGIVGAGRDKTILDGQGQGFVITVQGGASTGFSVSLSLISLTVTGSGGGRAGIINVPDFVNKGALPYLALSDVEVSNNTGSGVVNEGSLSVNNTRITNNSNSTFDGGGIYSASPLGGVAVSADSSIDNNTAAGTGGGIFLGSGTVLLPSTSVVRDNTPNNCATGDNTAPIPKCIN